MYILLTIILYTFLYQYFILLFYINILYKLLYISIMYQYYISVLYILVYTIINTGVYRGIAPRPITPAIGGLYSHTRSHHITKSIDIISIYYYIKHIN